MDNARNRSSGEVGDARRVYASNALIALAVGFAAGTAVMATSPRLRTVNAVAALACGLGAAAFRALARSAPSLIPQNPELKTEPSLATVDFSIIIPVYNRPDLLAQLLERLAAQTPSWTELGTGEIVIVDDGSVDDTAAVAERLALAMPITTCVISIAHGGPCAARNAGFAAARGGVGIGIDSDCLPYDGWLNGLIDEVRAQAKTVCFARVRSEAKVAYPIENVPNRKGYVSASFAIDRLGYCKIGGFHLEYGASHDDTDFVQVAKNAGYRIVRASSEIYHPIRYESIASIWRAGLISKYSNLFASRHGFNKGGTRRTTPYYFFGVAGNHGSSIAFSVAATNLLAVLVLSARKSFVENELPQVFSRSGAVGILYVLALAALGLRVGAGMKRLPRYVATLATFQVATLVGRLQGSVEYGMLLL